MSFRHSLLFKPLVAVAALATLGLAGWWLFSGSGLPFGAAADPDHCPGDVHAYQRPDGSVLVKWSMRDVQTRYTVERWDEAGGTTVIVTSWGGDNFDDRTALARVDYRYSVMEDFAPSPHGCSSVATEPMPEDD